MPHQCPVAAFDLTLQNLLLLSFLPATLLPALQSSLNTPFIRYRISSTALYASVFSIRWCRFCQPVSTKTDTHQSPIRIKARGFLLTGRIPLPLAHSSPRKLSVPSARPIAMTATGVVVSHWRGPDPRGSRLGRISMTRIFATLCGGREAYQSELVVSNQPRLRLCLSTCPLQQYILSGSNGT